MSIDNYVKTNSLGNSFADWLRRTYTEYMPNPATLNSNKNKAIAAGTALLICYMLPGNQSLIEYAAILYGSTKAYHAVRDWAGK